MKKNILLTTFLLLVCMSGTAHAAGTAVGGSAAFGDHSSSAFTVFAEQVYDPWVSGELGEIAPTAEIGASWWSIRSNKDVYGAFLAPGIRLSLFTSQSAFRPYLGGSLGGAVITERTFDQWKMGSNAVFRTKGMAGVQFGDSMQHRLQGEYTTHSTWGITTNDDAFDTYGVSYGFNF